MGESESWPVRPNAGWRLSRLSSHRWAYLKLLVFRNPNPLHHGVLVCNAVLCTCVGVRFREPREPRKSEHEPKTRSIPIGSRSGFGGQGQSRRADASPHTALHTYTCTLSPAAALASPSSRKSGRFRVFSLLGVRMYTSNPQSSMLNQSSHRTSPSGPDRSAQTPHCT